MPDLSKLRKAISITIQLDGGESEAPQSPDQSLAMLKLMQAMQERMNRPDPQSFDSTRRLRVVSDTRPIGGG